MRKIIAAILFLNAFIVLAQNNKPLLTPVTETKLDSERSVVYCATFQMAWDSLEKLAKGKIEMEDPSPWVKILNENEITQKSLPYYAYVSMAGFVKDGIVKKIDQALKKKFKKGIDEMSFSPSPDANIIAFSYLKRRLPFEMKFRRFRKEGLLFGKTKVSFFGCTSKTADYYSPYVKIIHFNNEDDFTLKLITKNKSESIILAKIPKPETLKKAIDLTAKRLKTRWKSYTEINKNGKTRIQINEISYRDSLFIPVIYFDSQTNYDELCNKSVKNKIFNDMPLAQAFQKVKFLMNESGALLESEAGSCEGGSSEPRKFIFDKAFLLALWRNKAPKPYLAIWVNGPDVMIPKKK
jgi:hypothetical protein